jgi:GTP-binding protein HflX
LKEIGAGEKSMVLVFNKIDQLKDPFILEDETLTSKKEYLKKLKKSWMAKQSCPTLFVSATSKLNLEELRNTLADLIDGFEKKV